MHTQSCENIAPPMHSRLRHVGPKESMLNKLHTQTEQSRGTLSDPDGLLSDSAPSPIPPPQKNNCAAVQWGPKLDSQASNPRHLQ